MTSLRHIAGVVTAAILGIASAHAQWTNPTSGSTYYAVMADSNGVVRGFGRLETDRYITDELELGGDLITSWSDVIDDVAAVNVGATVTAPYGLHQISAAGGQIALKGYIKGVDGITVSNDSQGVVYVSGSLTGSVESLFSPAGATNNGILYVRRWITPLNPIEPILFPAGTNGYLKWDGTNFSAVSELAATATNALQLAGQDPSYYRKFSSLTNLYVFDDAVSAGGGMQQYIGFDFGSGINFTTAIRTNGGITGTVLVVESSLASTGACATCSNEWTEANTWNGNAILRYQNVQIVVDGNGNANTGKSASVSLMGTNLQARGDHSSVNGGRDNAASGNESTISGGSSHTASGAGSTIAGGRDNAANGNYASIIGGYDSDAAGDYSAVWGGREVAAYNAYSATFGRFAENNGTGVVFFAWGQANTNKTKSTLPTNGLEVAGTVKATRFEGDGSALTGITAGGGSGSGFPLTTNGNLAGFALTNGNFVGNGSGITNIPASAVVGVATGVPVYAESDPVAMAAGFTPTSVVQTIAATAAQAANATSTQGRVWTTNAPPTVGAVPYWTGSQIGWSEAPPASSTGNVSSVNNTNGNILIVGGSGIAITTSNATINIAASPVTNAWVYIGQYVTTGGEQTVTFVTEPLEYAEWFMAAPSVTNNPTYNQTFVSLEINGQTNATISVQDTGFANNYVDPWWYNTAANTFGLSKFRVGMTFDTSGITNIPVGTRNYFHGSAMVTWPNGYVVRSGGSGWNGYNGSLYTWRWFNAYTNPVGLTAANVTMTQFVFSAWSSDGSPILQTWSTSYPSRIIMWGRPAQ